jgi:hypothetical protein
MRAARADPRGGTLIGHSACPREHEEAHVRIRLSVLIIMLMLPQVAQAQIPITPVAPPSSPSVSVPRTPDVVTEPRLPSNAQSPTDYQDVVRTPSGGGGAVDDVDKGSVLERSGDPAGPGGYSGGDMNVDGGRPELYGGRGFRRRDVPRYHSVQKGDTLWSLCSHYYGDPWAWPQIWAYNKKITNPHWIYPGDQVRLLSGPTVSPRGERQETIRVSGYKSRNANEIKLRQNGFADPKELEHTATIAGSKEERLLLSQYDELYIEGNDKFLPKKGESYTVYRVRETIKSDKKTIGHLVEILGTVRVKEDPNKKKVARAVVTESINPIERGDRIGVLRRRYVRVPIKSADRNLEGLIVATMREGKHIATEELVFVDRGRNQGVQQGHRMLVVRRGDGYKRLLQDADDNNPRFPRETVAEVTALDVRDDVFVGLVTRAIREVRIGDRVQMRRGY